MLLLLVSLEKVLLFVDVVAACVVAATVGAILAEDLLYMDVAEKGSEDLLSLSNGLTLS